MQTNTHVHTNTHRHTQTPAHTHTYIHINHTIYTPTYDPREDRVLTQVVHRPAGDGVQGHEVLEVVHIAADPTLLYTV